MPLEEIDQDTGDWSNVSYSFAGSRANSRSTATSDWDFLIFSFVYQSDYKQSINNTLVDPLFSAHVLIKVRSEIFWRVDFDSPKSGHKARFLFTRLRFHKTLYHAVYFLQRVFVELLNLVIN